MDGEPNGLAGRTLSRVPYWKLVLAGIVAGAVVFGLGSRVAMRLVGIAASPEHLREPTNFGTVGEITFQGTLGLVIVGAVGGLLFGLLYLAIRSWLPGGWAARGLAFGLLLLSPVGVFIVASSKKDFDLTSLALIFSLFAAMILLEGLATAWLIERLGRDSLPPPTPGTAGYVVLGGLASLGFVALGNSVSGVL
jgi:hypothetical protein